MIKYCNGNILQADAEALVNTVNTVGVMGKGIALQFKNAYPEMERAYISACKEGSLRIGKVQVWNLESIFNPKYIINFPTKKHWRYKSKLSYIQAGLADLVDVIYDLNIKSIAIPPLGCGLGGLDWTQVDQEIKLALGYLDIDVLVYPPLGVPKAEDMIVNTKVPKLTPNLANFLRIINDYYSWEYTEPTLVEIQKLAYFYQCAGERLNLRFEKKWYGPYSANLRHWLNNLEGHYIRGIGDGTKSDRSISIYLLPDCMDKVNEFLSRQEDSYCMSRKRANDVISLIQGFENPFNMELLASVHWVATQEKASTLEKCIERIQKWSLRKKNLMLPRYIEIAWNRLISKGWI